MSDTRKQVGMPTPKMLFPCKMSLLMIVPIIEHLPTPLFLSQIVAGNKCYVQTKDIIIHPLTEYLSKDINQCGTTSCHTCNIFIHDQSFESNLTGKKYKTISNDRLSCATANVIYGIHCEKPVAGNKCYVQTKDIIIHPLTEYLSKDINQCGATSCHTCNIFINDQSFESNLTGKENKTISNN